MEHMKYKTNLTDIREFYIRKIYIPELKLLLQISKRIFKKTKNSIEKQVKSFIHKNKKLIKTNLIPEWIKDNLIEEYQQIEFMKYLNLIQILGSAVALWENQLNDFFSYKNVIGLKSISKELYKNYLYDLSNNKDIQDIIHMVNYYKHGPSGNAEKYLLQTIYLNTNNYETSNTMKSLNIDETYINKAFTTFINFWSEILININMKS